MCQIKLLIACTSTVHMACSCRKVYIGETKWRLETRVKEYWNACDKDLMGRSVIAKQAWESHHPIKWVDISVVDQARRPKELMLKEALHIQLTNSKECFD